MVGLWGVYLMFKVTAEQVYTFRNWQRNLKGRWAVHDILHNKPRAEFLGIDADEHSMEVVVDAQLRIPPINAIRTLKKGIELGRANLLFIGGENYGRFYMEDLSVSHDIVLNGGEIARATLSFTLREYN